MIGRILVGLLAANSLGAQALAPRHFDVVSVKPCNATDDGGGRGLGGGARNASPGRLDLKCQTVMGLIRMAYVQFADGKLTPPGRSIPVSGGPAVVM
jgi:hypothetical protein